MEKKSKKKEMIQWGIFLAVVAFFAVTGLHKPLIAGLQKGILATGMVQPNINEGKTQPKKIDLNVVLVDEQGRVVNMNEFDGKVIFINLWATWCPPCRAEMPGIQNLFDTVGKGNIEFVMISSDRDFQTAIAYKEKEGFTFPIYQLASALPAELESEILPTTHVIDTKGQMVMTETGMAKYDSEKFIAFVNGLLNE